MPKLKKRIQNQGLNKVNTWITDKSPTSEYFRLNQLPDILTGGKNGFLITGTPNLVRTTDVLVEILDSNGNSVFCQPIKNFDEGLSRVVSIEVYDDTPAGIGLITILGQLAFDKDGKKVPKEFADTYNVKWQKEILIEPFRTNTTPIRLYNKPKLTITEQLIPYRQSVTGSAVSVTTGSIHGQYIAPQVKFVGDDINNQQRIVTNPVMNITVNTDIFNRNVIPGTLELNINGLSFTSSIASVLNSTTAQLTSIPLTSNGQPVSSFDTIDYKLKYNQATTFTTSSLFRSFANIQLSSLTTFTGDIQRAKFYVKGIDQNQNYQLLEDVVLESIELTTSRSFSGENISLGEIEDPSFIANNWESGQFINSYIVSGNVPLTYDNSNLLDSVVVQSTTPNPAWTGIKQSFTVDSTSEYSFRANILCIKSDVTQAATIDVYLDSPLLSGTQNNQYGYKICTLVVPAGVSRKLFDKYAFNFTAPISDNAKLKYVVTGGTWYIANSAILASRETGFNPDEISVFTPIINRRFERLQFKVELFDANSNLVPLSIETDPLYFDGGNLVFRGGDTRIDGILTVAPSGSGPLLTSKGFLNSASVFTPGQAFAIGPSLPKVKDASTAFFAGTSSNGPEISIGDKLYGYRVGGNGEFILEIEGSLLIVTGSSKFDIRNLFPPIVTQVSIIGQDINNIYVSASAIDPLGLEPTSISTQIQPVGAVLMTFDGTSYTIGRPSGSTVAKVTFTGTALNRRNGSDFVSVQPIGSFTGSFIVPPFLNLVMSTNTESTGSLIVSTSVNSASGTLSVPSVAISSQQNVRYVNSLGAGQYEIGKPVSGSGQVIFMNMLSGYVSNYDTVLVNNQSSIILPRLTVIATVTAETSVNVTVSCSVVDPIGQPAFTLSTAKEPATSPITITGPNPFVITRPAGTGSARVNFIGSQTNRVSDIASVTIPGQQLPTLIIKTVKGITTPSSSVYTTTVIDPIPENPIQFKIIPSNASILNSVTGSTLNSGDAFTYTALFPNYGSGDGRIGLTATSSLRQDGTDAIDLTEIGIQYTSVGLNAIAPASVSFTTTTSSIVLTCTLDKSTLAQSVEMYSIEFDTMPDSSASAVLYGSQLLNSPFNRSSATGVDVFGVNIPVFKPSTWVVLNLIPIDAINRRGTPYQTIIRIPSVPAGSGVPNAFTGVNNSSFTTTTITNTVTIPASNAPTSINVYKNGVLDGAPIAANSAGSTQTIVHSGLTPNTNYGFIYGPVNISGEGTRTSNLSVTTANIPTTLAAPDAVYTGVVGSTIQFSVTNAGAYPAGTTFTGEYKVQTAGAYTPLSNITNTTFSGAAPTVNPKYGFGRFYASCTGYTTSGPTLVEWNSGNQL